MQSDYCNAQLKPGNCEQHIKEQLKHYCTDCEAVTCVECSTELHKSHHLLDLTEAAGEFRKEIEKDLNALKSCLETYQTDIKLLENCEKELSKDVETAEKEISVRRNHLKDLVDKHTKCLQEELVTFKEIKLEELRDGKEKTDNQLVAISDFILYYTDIASKGSLSDICRAYSKLHQRTVVHRQMMKITHKNIRQQCQPSHISFEQVNVEGLMETYNIVGTLKEKTDPQMFRVTTSVIVTANGYNAITGWAILDQQIFFTREESLKVEIYDLMSFSYQGKWKLQELINPAFLATCERNRCLYVIDVREESESTHIFRVEPSGKRLSSWSTGEDCVCCLSVTSESTVLLPVYLKSKVNEYSPDGQCIREVYLSSEPGTPLGRPIHALKLTNGQFLVSFGDLDDDDYEDYDDEDGKTSSSEDEDTATTESEEDIASSDTKDDDSEGGGYGIPKQEQRENDDDEEIHAVVKINQEEEAYTNSDDSSSSTDEDSKMETIEHKLCLINTDGVVLKSFGHAKGSGRSQLNLPSCLELDTDGCVIVADNRNNRVLLLSPDLEFKTELVSRRQGLRGPRGILLHKLTNRLFIMSKEWTGNRRRRGRMLFYRVK